MVRLFALRVAIQTLKRAIAISGKLKPKTWAHLAITQAALATICFWGYQQLHKHEVKPASKSTIQVDSALGQMQQEKLVFHNRTTATENEIAQYLQDIRETSLTLEVEMIGRVQAGRTGKSGAGPTYREAAEKLRRYQQLLANAEEQLERNKQILATADNRVYLANIGLDDVSSKSPISLSTIRKNTVIAEPIDPSVFGHIALVDFSKRDETMIREAVLAMFTAQCAEAFNEAGLRNPSQAAFNSGIMYQSSRDLYVKQAWNWGGIADTETRNEYQWEFSAMRAQAGTASPVITAIESTFPRTVNGSFNVSLSGSSFIAGSYVVIINEHSSTTYHSAYNHFRSMSYPPINTPYQGSGIHTHFALRSYDSAVEDMRLSVQKLQNAEAIRSDSSWGGESLGITLKGSDTPHLRHELSGYRFIHFATHGLLDSENPKLSSILLSIVSKVGGQEDGFLQLPFWQFPRFEPPTVLQVASAESQSLLDMLVKLMLLFQAIIFTVGSATSSVFIWLNYRRGKLDLKLKELQVREAEIRVENMERDRARAVQETAQSGIVLLG